MIEWQFSINRNAKQVGNMGVLAFSTKIKYIDKHRVNDKKLNAADFFALIRARVCRFFLSIRRCPHNRHESNRRSMCQIV